jgi:HlyD family secretion protein
MTQDGESVKVQTESLAALLNADGKKRRRPLRWVMVLAVVLLVVLAVAYRIRASQSETNVAYETEKVTRGTIYVTVEATGNLQPTNKVEVGSELSGLVETVLVDDNDHVTKGQVIARLDISKLRDTITRSNATLASAQAKQAQAEAALVEATANIGRLREVSELSKGKVPSKSEMETAEATLAKAKAEVASAKASVNDAQASLSSDQINMSKASIRSPIDGVVLSRSVEPGQTVAASLQVATLFTIAEDLREMDLEVAVDEADVGKVHEGQEATFTVDTHPGRRYSAKVTRVAFGSTTTNNVVTYTTVLKVKNDDLSLRPGMTATAIIACVTRPNVLLVPNGALRFTPPDTVQQSRSVLSRLMPGPPADDASKAATRTDRQQVWMLRDGKPAVVAMSPGQTDGRHTEVVAGELKEGQLVITDATTSGGAK